MRHVPDPKRIEVVDEAVAAVLRRMTPAQRLAIIADCNHTARVLIETRIRWQHPDWDDALVAAEVARRMSRDSN